MSAADQNTATRHDAGSHRDAGTRFDVAILGAGTAAASLVESLHGSGISMLVFEPGRVGGICPFEACVPSKSMLHDAATGTEWTAAVARRAQLTHHLDDAAHAEELTSRGATIVRAAARLVDPRTVEAAGRHYTADHVVIATGARPVVPDVDGLKEIDDLVWTSGDALTDERRPDRLLIVGGGVIGCELAHVFAGFGSSVTLVEPETCLFADLAPEVCEAITAIVGDRVDELRLGTRPVAARRHGDRAAIRFDDDVEQRFDRVLLATGRRPALDGLGLESIGLEPDQPLPVGGSGRVGCAGSVWAIGDVAGRDQYTHAAGHHGSVVADQLAGRGVRRLDDVVAAACMFTSPPMFTVGPSHAATVDDEDVVWVVDDLDGVVRANTDGARGVLAVAGSRSTRRLVAAHGIGPRFDELVHAVVYAIDGAIPVDRLVQSIIPFPTMGNALQQRLLTLRDAL